MTTIFDRYGRDGKMRFTGRLLAHGDIDDAKVASFRPLLDKKYIDWCWVDTGDADAGSIRVLHRAANDKDVTRYRITINRNHAAAVKFTTLAHELGHLFLGHLGPDRHLSIPGRSGLPRSQREIEAESVAYLVCERHGVISRSHPYLSRFVSADTSLDHLDVYQVMRASGQIEALLGLTAHTQYDRPARRPQTHPAREAVHGQS